MTEIAKEAGVSVGVVSRLLRGDPTLRVSPTRRQQILEVKERLGGVKARPRKRRSTQLILVPINREVSQEWMMAGLAASELIHSLQAGLEQHGFRFHFTFFDVQNRHEFYKSLVFRPTECDGLLLLSREVDQWLSDLLRTHDFPHVSVDYYAEQYCVNTVRAHTFDGIRQAVHYLQSLGHRDVGYLGPQSSYRYSLTAASILGAGLPHDASQCCNVEPLTNGQSFDVWADHAEVALDGWLAAGRCKPTALICANDWMAQGALRALKRHGLEPGRDLSIVGHDNLEKHANLDLGAGEPVMTTIDNPSDLIGRRAAELLLNQILHGQSQIVHERIPAPLIVRRTTGCPSMS